MSAQTEKKQEADLSPEVDSLLPQAHTLAKVSSLDKVYLKLSIISSDSSSHPSLLFPPPFASCLVIELVWSITGSLREDCYFGEESS